MNGKSKRVGLGVGGEGNWSHKGTRLDLHLSEGTDLLTGLLQSLRPL